MSPDRKPNWKILEVSGSIGSRAFRVTSAVVLLTLTFGPIPDAPISGPRPLGERGGDPESLPTDNKALVCSQDEEKFISTTFVSNRNPRERTQYFLLKPNFLENSSLVIDTEDPNNPNCPPLNISFSKPDDNSVTYKITYRAPTTWASNAPIEGGFLYQPDMNHLLGVNLSENQKRGTITITPITRFDKILEALKYLTP